MNNETQSSRYSVGNKVLSVALTAALSFTTFAGLGTVTSTNVTVDAANDYGLADSIQEGTILHCFDWKYKDITEELPNIAAAGFTSIQTSPAQTGTSTGIWYRQALTSGIGFISRSASMFPTHSRWVPKKN